MADPIPPHVGMPLEPAPAVATLLEEVHQSGEVVSFHKIEAAIRASTPADAATPLQKYTTWVDAAAFGLDTSAYGNKPWRLYFGPVGHRGFENGEFEYFPEVRALDERALDLWQMRLEAVTHPALLARYADLLWEVGPALGRNARNPEHAKAAIAAYEEMAEDEKSRQNLFGADDAAHRMLDLALNLNDNELRDRAVNLLVKLHREAVQGTGRINLQIADRLLWEKKLAITAPVVEEVIGDLEKVLASSTSDGGGFDPFLAEHVTRRLARYYARLQSAKDQRRVHAALGGAFERLAGLGNAMAAASHFDKAASEYAKASDKAAHDRVRVARAAAVEASNAEMHPHSVEMKITFDEMEQFLSQVVLKDNPRGTLIRLASQFVPRVDDLRNQVLALAQAAPIQALISINIHEDEHIAAVVGSVDDDMEGRIMHAAGQSASFDFIHMHPALERCMEVHDFSPHHLAGWAGRLGAFDDLALVAEGIEAWMVGDGVKALHVLIPQIEAGLRDTLKGLGRPIVKDHPGGGGRQILLNMAEVLSAPALQEAFGPDLVLYFRSRYVDPRAKNLRNVVAHGLVGPEDTSPQTTDILKHSLLVLGCWDGIASHRKAQAAEDKQPKA